MDEVPVQSIEIEKPQEVVTMWENSGDVVPALDLSTKPCKDCGNPFPIEDDMDWKTFCESCYDKRTENPRRCKKCPKNVSPGAPTWTKLCVECFKLKRVKTHTTCELCPPERSTHLRKKIGEVACKTCLAEIAKSHAQEAIRHKRQQMAADQDRDDEIRITRVREMKKPRSDFNSPVLKPRHNVNPPQANHIEKVLNFISKTPEEFTPLKLKLRKPEPLSELREQIRKAKSPGDAIDNAYKQAAGLQDKDRRRLIVLEQMLKEAQDEHVND
jgi:hypothetical protein